MPCENTSRKISLSVPTALWVGSDDGSGAPKPKVGESRMRCWASWSRWSLPVSPVLCWNRPWARSPSGLTTSTAPITISTATTLPASLKSPRRPKRMVA